MVEYFVELPEAEAGRLEEKMGSLGSLLQEKGVEILKVYALIPAYYVVIGDEKIVNELREQGYKVSQSSELHI